MSVNPFPAGTLMATLGGDFIGCGPQRGDNGMKPQSRALGKLSASTASTTGHRFARMPLAIGFFGDGILYNVIGWLKPGGV